jgi:ParB-like chromosome segregation protein Spo0J
MARPDPKPLVDPGLGDLRAEPGSREWAIGARASLWGKGRDLGKGVADVAIRLDALLTTGGWKHLFNKHGDPFTSIEDYITHAYPYGLGVSLDMMRHYLGLTHEGKAIRAHLAVKGYPTHHIAVANINRTGGTQVREKTDAVKVAEYAEAIEGGAAFPPIVVFFDGETHWLADGFHRVAACEKAGVSDVLAEVREGTREDALWFALSANKRHGLPMSQEDKRKAVRLLLSVEKWQGMSNRAIADHLGISDHTVATVKAGCATAQNAQLRTKAKGSDGKQRSAPGESSAAVRDLLTKHPDLISKSNRQIAETLDVSDRTVAKVRKELEAERNGEAPKSKRPTKTKAPAVAAAPAEAPQSKPTPQPVAVAVVAPVATAPSAVTTTDATAQLAQKFGEFKRCYEATLPAHAEGFASIIDNAIAAWHALTGGTK